MGGTCSEVGWCDRADCVIKGCQSRDKVEALAAVIHDAFHAPVLGHDYDAWLAEGPDGPRSEGFAFPWILTEENGKENFRRAARAALNHMAAVNG